MTINLEFKSKGVVNMLKNQRTTPYYQDTNVDELLRAYPNQTTRDMEVYMYMLGYINGKRMERVRRKQKNEK